MSQGTTGKTKVTHYEHLVLRIFIAESYNECLLDESNKLQGFTTVPSSNCHTFRLTVWFSFWIASSNMGIRALFTLKELYYNLKDLF